MKILIAFYSRTGVTKKLVEALIEKLDGEVITEEIKDTIDRTGIKGYLLAGRDATMRRLTKIEPTNNDPADFDLVIIGTPIWSWNLSTPVRTYLENNKTKFKKTALLATQGGSGAERALVEMEKITGLKNQAVLAVTTPEVIKNNFAPKIQQFLATLK